MTREKLIEEIKKVSGGRIIEFMSFDYTNFPYPPTLKVRSVKREDMTDDDWLNLAKKSGSCQHLRKYLTA